MNNPQMKVNLLYYTPLSIGVQAIRTCWQSFDKGGCYLTPTDNLEDSDIKLIERIVKKFKHESTIEHLNYNFGIDGISRACLQELARHRHQSLSVKSTRYTLKELNGEEAFTDFDNEFDYKRASKYLVWTGNRNVDITSFFALEDLRDNIEDGISNDFVKYSLPEAYKVSLVSTMNARALRNFLHLRTNKAALWEIRQLAYSIYNSLPKEHQVLLFNDIIYKEKEFDDQ
jgi:thymidylate synthase (FAD)